MDNFSNSVKLNNIKSYKANNTNTKNVFKNEFYKPINKVDYTVYEDIDYNEIDTENISDNVDILDVAAKTGATVLIGVTSVLSGILKIGEYINDGKCWVAGMATSGIARLFGNEELAKSIETQTMDYIARDQIGELNKTFYENTDIGRAINDASYMKYDSDVAKGIQNVTKEAAIIVGATAATVATGGAAAPLFAAGFAIGAGESAEKHFQDTENRDFWKDSIDIGIDGGIKGLSTVAAGRAGATAVNGVRTIANLGLGGIKETAKGTLKYFSKDALKSTIKNNGLNIAKNAAVQTFKDKDFVKETGTILLSNAKSCFDNKEVTFNDLKNVLLQTGSVYASNYVGNLAGGFFEGVVDYNTKISNSSKIYLEAQDLATKEGYSDTFESYREHAEQHVYKVTEYAENHMGKVKGINKEEVIFGALNHDLGMRSGYVKLDGKYVKISSLDSNEFNLGVITRENHPLNSAISILSDDLCPDGLDRDVVALLAMTHSKSTSGISHMGSKSEWLDCIDNLEEAFRQYSIDEGLDISTIHQRFEKLKNMVGDDNTFSKLCKEALLIRDADAMSSVATTVAGDTIMQNRNVSHVVRKSSRGTDYEIPVFDEPTELSTLTDKIYDINDTKYQNPLADVHGGVKFHAGELNTSFDTSTDADKYYDAVVKIAEPNEIPNSTFFAITERIGEANTYTNVDSRTFNIVLPKEAQGTALGKWYETQLKNYREFLLTSEKIKKGTPVGALSQFKVGIIDEQTYQAQKNFYQNIKIVYGD